MSLPVDTDLSEGDEQRWWGRPLAETRWQLELARLLVDPVLRGRDVAPGDGRPVILLPGFLAGDQTLVVVEESGMPVNLLAAYGAGIQVHVEDLAAHIAGRERCDADARWAELQPAYDALDTDVS